MKEKIVSVIVPCFNQEDYIEECLASVQKQTYINFECIVVNDGSTDASADKIMPFLEDKRFQLIDKDNEGVAIARNTGIAHSKGRYILPLDGDDVIGTSYVEQAVAVFENDESVSLVYCNARFFGDVDKTWELPDYSYESMLVANCIFCTAMYREEEFAHTEGYDPKLVYGYEDWEFWLQLLKKESKVYKLQDTLFFYRQKANARNSFTQDVSKYENTMNYIFAKHLNKYQWLANASGTNLLDSFRKAFKEKNVALQLKKVKKSFSYKIFYQIESFVRNAKNK